MTTEKMHVPDNSIIFVIKFESEEDRTKAINSKDFDDLFGKMGKFAIANNGSMSSKTSKS
jgi:hypothetical protein